MSNRSFKMLVEKGDNPSLFDKKLIAKVDGESRAGYVFTIYAKVNNLNVLNESRTLERREKRLILDETHDSGKRLVMTIHKVNDIGYYQSTKLQYPNSQAIEQVMVPISRAMYDHMVLIALSGIQFERFKIDVPNTEMVWEIDVYRGADGQRHNWVKMDLEVPNSLQGELPPIPFPIDDYIIAVPGVITPKQETFIESLYRTEWVNLDPNWVVGKLDYKELVHTRELPDA